MQNTFNIQSITAMLQPCSSHVVHARADQEQPVNCPQFAMCYIVENVKADDTNDFTNEVTGLGLTCATALLQPCKIYIGRWYTSGGSMTANTCSDKMATLDSPLL